MYLCFRVDVNVDVVFVNRNEPELEFASLLKVSMKYSKIRKGINSSYVIIFDTLNIKDFS